jgi:hypothetical protein
MKPKWIVRIVVGVVLLVLLVLGGMDYLAKSQAGETAAGLQAQIESNQVEMDVEQYVVGSPDLDTQPMSKTNDRLIYTWPGIIRDYRVEVECIGSPGKDGKRFVSRVEGPLSD